MDTSFKIKFDGRQHQIDANVLINSLIHTSNIIQEINTYLNAGKKIKIDIKATEKGSFVIHLELVETVYQTIKDIFTKENTEVAAAIITILTGAIGLKKFLKGRKPKKVKESGDKMVIEDENGQIYNVSCNVFNIYQNKVVQEALSKNFEAINEDPAITGFGILDEKDNILESVEKDDFKIMSEMPEAVEHGDRQNVNNNAKLHIIRASFDGSLKWDFLYLGNKISAKVNDTDFYELIDKGEAFAKGDILDVDLQISQKFDETINAYYNNSYQVTKINEHIPRGKQINIFEIGQKDT